MFGDAKSAPSDSSDSSRALECALPLALPREFQSRYRFAALVIAFLTLLGFAFAPLWWYPQSAQLDASLAATVVVGLVAMMGALWHQCDAVKARAAARRDLVLAVRGELRAIATEMENFNKGAAPLDVSTAAIERAASAVTVFASAERDWLWGIQNRFAAVRTYAAGHSGPHARVRCRAATELRELLTSLHLIPATDHRDLTRLARED